MDKELLYFLFNWAIIITLVIGFVYLLIISFIVKDYSLIIEKPLIFVIELIFMTVLPGIPLLFFAVSRGLDIGYAIALAVSLSAQSGAFHLIFQLSGLYKYTFGA